MPKMKTHRGAAKRFKVTGSGKIMRGKIGQNHILEKKSPKIKRNYKGTTALSTADTKVVARQLGLR